MGGQVTSSEAWYLRREPRWREGANVDLTDKSVAAEARAYAEAPCSLSYLPLLQSVVNGCGGQESRDTPEIIFREMDKPHGKHHFISPSSLTCKMG